MNGKTVYPVYLSIKKPMVFDAKGKTHNELPSSKQPDSLVISAKKKGSDGVVIRNLVDKPVMSMNGRYDATQYAVMGSTQIKSAIGNNGEFSPINPDIRFSRAEDKAKAAKDYVLDSVRIKRQVAENLHAKPDIVTGKQIGRAHV